MRADFYLFVISGRSLVAATRINHGDETSIFLFHLPVGEPELPHKFDSPDLKPDEVIGMINDSHLVGFRIANANTGFRYRAMLGTRGSAHHKLQRGLRFSRNEVIPSRKSVVVRI